MFYLTIFICLTATGFANGECPSIWDLPIMYDGSHFMCANTWRDAGGEYSVTSCNGEFYTFYLQSKEIFQRGPVIRLFCHDQGQTETKIFVIIGHYVDSFHDHAENSLGHNRYLPMGSIAVKAGCTLYMWMDIDFTGERYN